MRTPPTALPVALLAAVMLAGGCAQKYNSGRPAHAPCVGELAVDWPKRSLDGIDLQFDPEHSENASYETVIERESGRLIELKSDFTRRSTITLRSGDARFTARFNPVEPDRFDFNLFFFATASSFAIKPSPELTAEQASILAEMFRALLAPTRIRVIGVTREAGRGDRGLCIILPGIVGPTQADNEILWELLRRGWTVATVLFPDGMRAHRTQSQGSFDRDGSGLARVADGELADDIYAMQVVRAQLLAQRPALRQAPTALVGASFGALQVPACAERLERTGPEDERTSVDAAVIIGGGAPLEDLLVDSPLGREFLRLAGLTQLDDAAAEHVRVLIRKQCQLQPERCASALDGTPVLVIDGIYDSIVPQRNGENLWRALGEPERWRYPVGHLGLFMLVGKDEWDAVAEWIDLRCHPEEEARP